MQLCPPQCTACKKNRSESLALAPRVPPYARRSRRSSRMPRPIAMVPTSLNSPTTSKSTAGSHLHELPHGGLGELRGPVLGAPEPRFELVAELHELLDLGEDALLLLARWQRDRNFAVPRVTSLPRTIPRPLVRWTFSRIWVCTSHPPAAIAGVMYLVQTSRSERAFLSLAVVIRGPAWGR